MFPSPCGDYGSYQTCTTCQRTCKKSSFRPLAGIMVLIGQAVLLLGDSWNGFRPLAGIMVLIPWPDLDDLVYADEGFRPLAGIMVLISLRN